MRVDSFECDISEDLSKETIYLEKFQKRKDFIHSSWDYWKADRRIGVTKEEKAIL